MYVLRIPSEVISLDVLYFIFSAYFQIRARVKKKFRLVLEISEISCKNNFDDFSGRGRLI